MDKKKCPLKMGEKIVICCIVLAFYIYAIINKMYLYSVVLIICAILHFTDLFKQK